MPEKTIQTTLNDKNKQRPMQRVNRHQITTLIIQ